MAVAREHAIVRAEILLDGFGLGGRFDDDKLHKRETMSLRVRARMERRDGGRQAVGVIRHAQRKASAISASIEDSAIVVASIRPAANNSATGAVKLNLAITLIGIKGR